MVRLVLLGVWVILVTAGATYGALWLKQTPAEAEQVTEEDLATESLKTEMTSVPIVRGNEIVGYLIIQLTFQANRKTLETLHLEPQPYLIDTAFRVIFASSDTDFRHLRASDLIRLTTEIRDDANARIGKDLIREVLIQQLNFVRREDIRTNWIRKDGNG